jgi:hypothetical protein
VFYRTVLYWLLIPELLEGPLWVIRTARRFTIWLPTFSVAVPVLLLIAIMLQVTIFFT